MYSDLLLSPPRTIQFETLIVASVLDDLIVRCRCIEATSAG